VVLALPRGGVPVAYEVARALSAPLDVFIVRKLGVPGHDELAMGAVATGGVRVLNELVVRGLGIPNDVVDAVTNRELQELARRERVYRGGRPERARIVVTVPTAAPETCDALRANADEVVCAVTPDPFYAVGLWYEDFSQTSDEEVREDESDRSRRRAGSRCPGQPRSSFERVRAGTGDSRQIHRL
jgi:predicted phosphoribosyltransferase